MDTRGLKIGIIGGLISSVLVLIFIQPFLSFLWRAILAIGGSVHQGYVDRIYRKAAAIDNNPYGEPTLAIVVLVVLLAVLFWSVRSLESDPVAAKYFSRWVQVAKVVTWTMALVSFLLVFVMLAILRGTAVVAESFTQRLTVLAPAISDTEYKTLRARWASMRGQVDYDALVTAMDKRASELGITLPPVRNP